MNRHEIEDDLPVELQVEPLSAADRWRVRLVGLMGLVWLVAVVLAFAGILYATHQYHAAPRPGSDGSEWTVDPDDEAMQREIEWYSGPFRPAAP